MQGSTGYVQYIPLLGGFARVPSFIPNLFCPRGAAPQVQASRPPRRNAQKHENPVTRARGAFPRVPTPPPGVQLRALIPASAGKVGFSAQAPALLSTPTPRFAFSSAGGSLLGARAVYKFDIASAGMDVGTYLPHALPAFPHAHPNLETRFKHFVGNNRLVGRLVHHQITRRMTVHGQGDEWTLLSTLEPEKTYNMVISNNALYIVRADNFIASKHAFASGHARTHFAGEIKRDALNRISFNPRSGTYMPSVHTQRQAARLLRAMFPHLFIICETFEDKRVLISPS